MITEPLSTREEEIVDAMRAHYQAFFHMPHKTQAQFKAGDTVSKIMRKYGLVKSEQKGAASV